MSGEIGITTLVSASAGVFNPRAPKIKRGGGLYARAGGIEAPGGRSSPSKVREAARAEAAGEAPGGVEAPVLPDVPLGNYECLQQIGVTGTLNFDKDAPAVVGVLAKGAKVVALEGAVSDAGVKRVRVKTGWISLADEDGVQLLEKKADKAAAMKWRGGLAKMRQVARDSVEKSGGKTDDSWKGQWKFNASELKGVLEEKREAAEKKRREWDAKKEKEQERVRKKLNTKPLAKQGLKYVNKYASRKQTLIDAKKQRERAGRSALQPSVYGDFREEEPHPDPIVAEFEASPIRGIRAPIAKDWYEHDPSVQARNEAIASKAMRPVGFLGRTRGLGNPDLVQMAMPHDHIAEQGALRLPPRGREEEEQVEHLEREARRLEREGRRRARSTEQALVRAREEVMGEFQEQVQTATGWRASPESGRLPPAQMRDLPTDMRPMQIGFGQGMAEAPRRNENSTRKARAGVDAGRGRVKGVAVPNSLKPPSIPVRHNKKTGAKADAAVIAAEVRARADRGESVLTDRFGDADAVLASVSIPPELEAAAAAASIQSSSQHNPYGSPEQQQAGDLRAGGAASAPPGLAAGAQLGPGVDVVGRWRVSDVANWVRVDCGFAAHVPRFVEQGIDGQVLVELYKQLQTDASAVVELLRGHFGLSQLGEALRFAGLLRELCAGSPAEPGGVAEGGGAEPEPEPEPEPGVTGGADDGDTSSTSSSDSDDDA